MPMIDVYAAAGTFSDNHRRWGIAGRANTQADIAASARAALSAGG